MFRKEAWKEVKTEKDASTEVKKKREGVTVHHLSISFHSPHSQSSQVSFSFLSVTVA